MDISKFKNQALVKEPSLRDYRLEHAPAMAFELPKKFSIRDKIGKIKHQGSSGSCVAQATSYYVQLLNYLETGEQSEMSARDIYSLIFQPESGAYIKDAFQKVCNSGCIPEKLLPSYNNGNPPDENFMRNRSDVTSDMENAGMTYLAKKYFTWDTRNLDLYKQAIIQGNGMVTASWGNNTVWKNAIIELPAKKEDMVWRHGVFFTGYDDEKQLLEFVNSWNGWGDVGFGYIPYSYVTNGYLANPYTLIDLPNETWIKVVSIFENLKTRILEFIKNFKK